LSTSRPTIIADPYDNEASSIDEEAERIIRQRWRGIEEAQKAKTFGILVGLKPGQKSLEQAYKIKRQLEEKAKVAYLFAINEITPEALIEFPTVEAYVNTACPRLSVEDAQRFKVPMLSKNEALVVIGEMSWEELCRKGLFEN
jgi:2-(3-amino-3-carboxypropyl)histidine synthase